MMRVSDENMQSIRRPVLRALRIKEEGRPTPQAPLPGCRRWFTHAAPSLLSELLNLRIAQKIETLRLDARTADWSGSKTNPIEDLRAMRDDMERPRPTYGDQIIMQEIVTTLYVEGAVSALLGESGGSFSRPLLRTVFEEMLIGDVVRA
jgi:hypothetical protein